MDNNRSPRSREILGPRPTPLKIRKDSHKIIKKPPLAPQHQPPQPPPHHEQEPSQPRGPVIIYTVSPKIIHTHPNNFMTLVQRLTGKQSNSTSSSSTSTSAPNDTSASFDVSRGGSISPAARYAAMEKANNSNELGFMGGDHHNHHHHHHHQNGVIERPSFYHGGILSPGPTSLPSISPGFFSSVGPTDPQGLSSFFNDFNSILQASPTIQSPSSMDLFNNFFDS